MDEPAKNDCPDDDTILGFLRGTLPQEKRTLVAAHIASCLDCKSWLSGIQSIDGKSSGRPFKAFSWIWIIPILGIALLILFLLQLNNKTNELLTEPIQKGYRVNESVSVKFTPERQLEPGHVFPQYQRQEKVFVSGQMARNGYLHLFVVKSNGELELLYQSDSIRPTGSSAGEFFQVPVPADRRGPKPGLVFVLLLTTPEALSEARRGELQKQMALICSRSHGVQLMGKLEAVLQDPHWEHMLLGFENIE